VDLFPKDQVFGVGEYVGLLLEFASAEELLPVVLDYWPADFGQLVPDVVV